MSKVPVVRQLLALADEMDDIVRAVGAALSKRDEDEGCSIAAAIPSSKIRDWAGDLRRCAIEVRDQA